MKYRVLASDYDGTLAVQGKVNEQTWEQRALAKPPPDALLARLAERGVEPLSVGKAVIATTRSQEEKVAGILRDLSLQYHLILNKGALMALPAGVDKASGLAAALEQLGVAPAETVGVGDAENDSAFLERCGLSAAVANAIPQLKQSADVVLSKNHGAGVAELIEQLLR